MESGGMDGSNIDSNSIDIDSNIDSNIENHYHFPYQSGR